MIPKANYPPRDRFLLDRPHLTAERCVLCGGPPDNAHHIIPRSRIHKRDQHRIPLATLCGSGAHGCHGHAHGNGGRVTFDWEGGWVVYLDTRAMSAINVRRHSNRQPGYVNQRIVIDAPHQYGTDAEWTKE